MNRTSWIFIGATVVILAAFGFFFLKPIIVNDWQTYQATKNAQKELKEVSQKKDILTNLAQNNQLKNLKDIAAKYIPEEAQSGELVLELTAMAQQNNLSVEQVSLESKKAVPKTEETTTQTTQSQNQPSGPANSQEVAFALKVNGTFTDFLGFLKSTETSSRLIVLNSLTLSRGEKNFSAQISGKAYWKKTTDLEKTLANINVSKETIEKFQNLKTYSAPINLTHEEGFGRTDPFEAVK